MIAATQTRFIGWWRPDKRTPWTQLVHADGYDACMGSLVDALDSVHGGDCLVLRVSDDPNARRRRLGERRRR